MVALGGFSVTPSRPKRPVDIVWSVFLYLYISCIGWQQTFGLLSMSAYPDRNGVCMPSSFQAQCRTNTDCDNSQEQCWWGTCLTVGTVGTTYCQDQSDCRSVPYAQCYYPAEPPSTQTISWAIAGNDVYGMFMVILAAFLSIANLILAITSTVWVCRTGRSPCCRSRSYARLDGPAQANPIYPLVQ